MESSSLIQVEAEDARNTERAGFLSNSWHEPFSFLVSSFQWWYFKIAKHFCFHSALMVWQNISFLPFFPLISGHHFALPQLNVKCKIEFNFLFVLSTPSRFLTFLTYIYTNCKTTIRLMLEHFLPTAVVSVVCSQLVFSIFK